MKTTVSKADFSALLSKAAPVTKGKSPTPMLACVLLVASEGRVVARATNLELTVEAGAKAVTAEHGSVCVSADQLQSIVSAAPKGEITIETQGVWLCVFAGRAEYKLNTVPAEEFPSFDPVDASALTAVDSTVFAWLLDGVRRAVSTDDSRHNLCGVCIEAKAERIRFVASDGHRLSIRDGEWAGPPMTGIVPVPALKLAAGMSHLRLGIAASKFVAAGDDCVVTARCIEGAFPDYELVIPKEHKSTVVTSRDPLIAAIKRVSLMAKDNASTVRMTPADGRLLIEAITPQVGESRESVDAEIEGEAPQFGVNAVYLLDALESMECDEVDLRLSDNQSPVVVSSVVESSGLFVIMPIKM